MPSMVEEEAVVEVEWVVAVELEWDLKAMQLKGMQ